MRNEIVANLKQVFKPKEEYYGEWELKDLASISLIKKDKNCFNEYLERYYYGPLKVIFKDEEMVYDFKYSVISAINDKGRNLFFSKKTFLRNIITNIDDLIKYNGEEFYLRLKHELRIKKDMYRDVCNNGEKSSFYKDIKAEHLIYARNMDFDDYILTCKKKYTNLLSGYNTFLEFINRPIDLNSFINCFDESKLYLYTMYSLFNRVEENYNLYGRLDYSINYLDQYKKIVKDIRKKEKFYNTYIDIKEDNKKVILTIDDLLKKYDRFIKTIKE